MFNTGDLLFDYPIFSDIQKQVSIEYERRSIQPGLILGLTAIPCKKVSGCVASNATYVFLLIDTNCPTLIIAEKAFF